MTDLRREKSNDCEPADSRGRKDEGEEQIAGQTWGEDIVDIAIDQAGDPLWVTSGEERPRLVREHGGKRPWPPASIPWEAVPTEGEIRQALDDGAECPFSELREAIRTRVVLPYPQDAHASLLAAWVVGTYLLEEFHYFPILLLAGPPARGKSRLAKALVRPSFRGVYCASPSFAVLARMRGFHRATLAVDSENIHQTIESGGMGDLVLNSFERGGVVQRVNSPDKPAYQQMSSYPAFGATILLTNRALRENSPLLTRTLRISMPEAGSVLLPAPLQADEAMSLRARLVAWRAVRLVEDTSLPVVSVPFRGRMRDLATPLLQVLQAVAPDQVPCVTELLKGLEREARGGVADSRTGRVVAGLVEADAARIGEDSRLFVKELGRIVNQGLDPEDPHFLSAQSIGYALKELGLRTSRGGTNKTAFLTVPSPEQLKELRGRFCGPHKEPPGPPVSPDITEGPGVASQAGPRVASDQPSASPVEKTLDLGTLRDTRDARDPLGREDEVLIEEVS